MKYKISFNKGMAGKTNGEQIDPASLCEGQTPRFGRYWWFWIPSIDSNGGKLNSGDIIDINVHWLCFYAGVILWPR